MDVRWLESRSRLSALTSRVFHAVHQPSVVPHNHLQSSLFGTELCAERGAVGKYQPQQHTATLLSNRLFMCLINYSATFPLIIYQFSAGDKRPHHRKYLIWKHIWSPQLSGKEAEIFKWPFFLRESRGTTVPGQRSVELTRMSSNTTPRGRTSESNLSYGRRDLHFFFIWFPSSLLPAVL